MLGYLEPGCSFAGCIVPFNGDGVGHTPADVGYVMIDPGTPLPHVYSRNQVAAEVAAELGQGEALEKEVVTSRELLDELYRRNRVAFWLGGGVVGVLAISGIFGLLRR